MDFFLFMIVIVIPAWLAFRRIRKLEAEQKLLLFRLEKLEDKSRNVDTASEEENPAVSVTTKAKTQARVAEAIAASVAVVENVRKQQQNREKPPVEHAVGTRWTVWLGALALGLGAVFLVKHSIEQGYLTPEVRILFGIIFAGLLLAIGEYIRRSDLKNQITIVPGAYIPGTLTASGIIAAFATVYAAYALYHFLDPVVAFVMLAVVAVISLAYSLLHGPGLAAIGFLGSYTVPALVHTGAPAAWGLFPYLLFVTLACFFTAQSRSWLWLAVSALAASIVWGFIWFLTHWQSADITAMAMYIFGLLIFAYLFLKQEEPDVGNPEDEVLLSAWYIADRPLAFGLGAIALLSTALLRYDAYSVASWWVFAITYGALLLCAWHWPSLAILAPIAALLFGFAYGTWHFGDFDLLSLNIEPSIHPLLGEFLVFGVCFAGIIAIVGFFAIIRRNGEPAWAAASAVTPLVAFAYACWRAGGFEHSLPFGFAAIVLMGLATFAADAIDKTGKTRRFEVSAGIYVTVAVMSLALSLTILLEKGWLTIALASVTPALACIARQRKMPVLRWLAVLFAVIVAARFLYDPRIIGNELGDAPILNWLLYGYGLPVLAFALAASMFRKQADDWAPAVLEAAAILFTAALFFLEIRHFMNSGNAFASGYGLAEASMHTISWLGLSLGLQWMSEQNKRLIPNVASTILGIVSMFSILCIHLFYLNPLLDYVSIGSGVFFNDLLLGYLLPAIMCCLLLWRASGRRHPWFVRAVGFGAFALMFSWLTLEVRALFQGDILFITRITTDPEWYAYSAVWLVYGLVLLGAGIWLQQKILRHIAMAIVGFVVLKVFLSDMSDLTGLLRALSFIGLGVSLIGIGWLYQRIIFPENEESETS
jgi:uncharacterized membrane protein